MNVPPSDEHRPRGRPAGGGTTADLPSIRERPPMPSDLAAARPRESPARARHGPDGIGGPANQKTSFNLAPTYGPVLLPANGRELPSPSYGTTEEVGDPPSISIER